MKKQHKFLTVLFGPLGDALMTLALFDDMLRVAPDASFLILTRRNAAAIKSLAREYPSIEVRQIPNGLGAIPFFIRILSENGWTFLTLALASGKPFSRGLRFFFETLSVIPGNRTIGFYDSSLDVTLDYDISLTLLDNFRKLIPYALPEAKENFLHQPPQVKIPQEKPAHFSLSPQSYIAMHLFGQSIADALPKERWHSIIKEIAAQHPEKKIVLTGTPGEEKRAEEIIKEIPSAKVYTNFSLPELAWVIIHAALYIGIDTGVTHIASLLNQKSIVIRHCSDPSWLPTYNKNARVLLNSENCNPEDPTHCLLVEEDGHTYRRCTYDISNKLILGSVALALSSAERQIPNFAGVVDSSI